MKILATITLLCLTLSTSSAQNTRQIDSLHSALSAATHDTTRANILWEISKAHWDNDPVRALDEAKQCLSLSEHIGYKAGIGRAYESMCSIALDRGDYSRALETNRLSMTVRKEIADKKGIAGCFNLLAEIHRKQGNIPEAMTNNISSLTLSEEINDKNGIANSSIGLGLLCTLQGSLTDALQYYNRALHLKQELGENVGVLIVYNNIGHIYLKQKNHREAIKMFNASLAVAQEIGNKSGMANAYGNIGVANSQIGYYEEALRNVLLAKNLKEELGDKNGVVNSYINLGEVYFRLNRLQESEDNYRTAISRATAIGKIVGVMNGYEGLAQVDSAKGDHRAATEHYKLFIAARDSVRSAQNIGKVVALQMNYAFKKKEDSLKSVQDKKDALSKVEIEKQRLKTALLEQQYNDSLIRKENENNLAALSLKFAFDKEQDSVRAEQAKKDAVADQELQGQKLVRNAFIGGFAILLMLAALLLFQRNKIDAGKKRSDSLLLNILPAEVAEELKQTGTAEARLFDNVTVLFTDFKSFTTVSERLTPQELVNELHTCFKAFDEICGSYGIEKIKTIGDAYLAVCGLPLAEEHHAEKVIRAALEIRTFMIKRAREYGGRTFEVRIGVNSGSVVAGIVGVKKYSYDIWGDTVNTAARMEQNSEAGKVNISESTYQLVSDTFACEYRGEIDAKNKGKLKMYFVEGEINRA